ncbi:MAG: hypothetical protein LAQ69_24430 [Acidobacteriia bacterium]|nr:hypothetical protein [Terriglobia bacterium]
MIISSSNPLLTVPPSVTVAAAATTGTFTATAGTIPSDQNAIVTATLNGLSQTTTVSLVSAVLVSSVACNPTSLGPNASSTCTVSLTKVAPAGGAPVTLRNTNTVLTVPASVTVAAGSTSATFNATTASIASDQSATVTGTYNSSSGSATISLVAPVLVSSLACNPTSLGPISSSTCTVALTKAAPSGGALVTLSNTNIVLTVPASVTVAAGATSATFNVTTVTILSDQNATITATYNGSSQSVTIGLASSVQISSLACPANLGPNASGACTVTLTKAAPTGGAAVTLTNTNTVLTVPASVTVAAGLTSATFNATTAGIASDQSATVTATYNSSSANATVSLVAPVLVSSLACNPTTLGPNASSTCTITLSKAAPAGGTTVSLSNNNATLTTPTSASVSAGSTSTTFNATTGGFTSNQTATVTATLNGISQNVTFNLAVGLAVSSVACNPTSLTSSAISSCTITLNGPVPSGWSVITLVSNSPSLTVPSSMIITAGSATGIFNATAGTITSNATATVTATLNGISRSATLNLTAPSALSSLACNPTSLGPNGSSACTVTLTQAAPTGGTTVSLSDNNAVLTAPTAVTVAAGATTATFNATTGAIPSDQSATLTATLNGVSQNVTISLVASMSISSLACNPTSLGPNASSACTVTLTKAAPTGGTAVSLSNWTPVSLVHVTPCGAGAFPATACTIPATAAGNLIVVGWSSRSGTSPIISSLTDNAGNAYVEAGNARAVAATGMVDIWYARNSKAGATILTITPNPTGTIGEAVIWEFSHADAVSPLDQTAVLNSQPSTATPSGATVVTAVPGEVVVSVVVPGSTPTGLHAGNPFTNDLLFSGAGWAHLFTSSVGSYAAQWDATLGSYASSTVSFKAASNVTLTTPAGVTVAAGSTSATFNAASGTIPSDQSATVMATLNGASQNVAIGLVAPVVLSSLACNPTTLGAGASSTCTVTLTKAAPAGGITVSVSNNNAALTSPTSVTVAAGSLAGVFNVTTGAIPSDQSVTVTATWNGVSQSATIGLVASVALSSLACNPTSLHSNASSTCTVTLTKAASAGGAVVALSSNNALLPAPASVTVAVGATSATFTVTAGTIATDQTATVTATLSGLSKPATLNLVAPVLVSALGCNPTSLGSGAGTTCTVTLSKGAPAGGAVVALSSNNVLLPVPTSVTVAVGATTATFTATAGTIGSDQAATLTATLNSQSQSATINLVTAVLVSALGCNPTSLGSGAGTTCTVTLSKAAPAGGAVVALSSNNALLPTPASVTVAVGATTGAFTTTAGTIGSDQTATLTATLNSQAKSATINLVAAAVVSALGCNPTSLGSGAGTTCTVTLSKAAPAGGAVVALSSNNALLTTPPSVTVLAGSITATFTATTGTITLSQTGSVTASYNGSSQSASISLVAAVQVTSLICNPSSLPSSAITACTVTLSQTAAANTLVSLSSNSPLITVPASVTILAGSSSAGFNATTGTIITDTSGVITATLGGTSQNVVLTLLSPPTLASITCSPTALPLGGSSTCTVSLSRAAGAVTVVGLSTSDFALSTPSSATVPPGSAAVAFLVSAQGTPNGWIILTATLNGVSKSVILTISAITPGSQLSAGPVRPSSISCTPKTLPAGESGLCQIALDGVVDSSTAELQLSSSSDSIKLPATITTRPGQSSVQFQIDAALAPADRSAVITAKLGAEVAQETVTIGVGRRSRLSTPRRRLVKYGTEVRFSVFSSDPGASLSVTSLPPGASFDATSGTFDWIPTGAQEGTYEVTFNALSPTGEVITEIVDLEVDAGAPAITRVINAASHSQEAACSPGAIGRLEGRWLSKEAAASDASGSSLRLSGTAVIVNGDAVPILYASATRVDFLCPASVPGSQLQILVDTAGGRSQAVQATARELAPGIFSIDGSDAGQGMVLHAGGSRLVMVRNYRYAAQPAQPGDVITLYATGMEGASEASVRIGKTEVAPDSVNKAPGFPGLWRLSVTVPSGEIGNAVGLSIVGRMSNGASVPSNQIRIAIEASGR